MGTTRLTVAYSGAPPADDTTPDSSYKLFYLRNLAVTLRAQAGVLPWRSWPSTRCVPTPGRCMPCGSFPGARLGAQPQVQVQARPA